MAYVDSLKTLREVDLTNKRVVLRVDYDVLFKPDGSILNNHPIWASVETVKYLQGKGARAIVIISHLGKPNGKVDDSLSFTRILPDVKMILRNKNIIFLPDCVGLETETACADPPQGSVFLCENLRFHPEEEGEIIVGGRAIKEPEDKIAKFRAALRKLGDIFVMDAFGCADLNHSSLLGEGFEERAVGLLVAKEMIWLNKVISNTPKPSLAIVGGLSVFEKMPLLNQLVHNFDNIYLCGGLAFTFLNILYGMKVGASYFEEESVQCVRDFSAKAESEGVILNFPLDFLCVIKGEEHMDGKFARLEWGIPKNWMGVDIGPRACARLRHLVSEAEFIFWNGLPGAHDLKMKGTKSLIETIVRAAACDRKQIVVTGKDTCNMVVRFNGQRSISHISTGLTSTMTYLCGNPLPALEVFKKK